MQTHYNRFGNGCELTRANGPVRAAFAASIPHFGIGSEKNGACVSPMDFG
jgi:hypothetical protein